MSKYRLADDCPSNVRAFIEGFTCEYDGMMLLVDYDTKILEDTLAYITNKKTHAILRRQIETELKQREEAAIPNVSNNIHAIWFEPMWWAVMSLFGKGEMKRSDPNTKSWLKKVKSEWRHNCGG
jgi:hypothetical protein